MNKTHFFDIIIIGSGIAGLYSALNIQKFSPTTTFAVLEKYKRQWIGGRTSNEMFCGTEIVTGAGIGRKQKDVLLIRLLKELHLPIQDFLIKPYYSKIMKRIDVNKVMDILKRKYNGYISKNQIKGSVTFQDFATDILGKETYQTFLENVGYTDFQKEDAYQTIYHYGMEDNTCCLKAFHVPWKEMIHRLVEKIGVENVHTSKNVVKIQKVSKRDETRDDTRDETRDDTRNGSGNFLVETDKGVKYFCNKIIIATTITSIRELIPGAKNKQSIYQEIHGQPFLRLYGKFSKSSIPIMKEFVKGYTIVPGPLQKIIPMDADKGVYMIAYSDNQNALFLKKYLENTSENRDKLCSLIEISLGMPVGSLKMTTIKDYYWPIGTHYYSPLDKQKYGTREKFIEEAQHPDPCILVVGEVVSNDQGWTKGALESVEEVLDKKWILK
jgi:ribosomal protein L24E